MLCKWITCVVNSGMRDGFASAQEAWASIAGCPGFVGQLGGFTSGRADILAFWQSRPDYVAFMQTVHDKVANTNRQSDYYSDIQVQLREWRFDIPGTQTAFATAIAQAAFVCIDENVVRRSNDECDAENHLDVWSDELTKARGFLAGTCWATAGETSRCQVTTAWQSKEAHEQFAAVALTPTDNQFAVQPSWTVLPSRVCEAKRNAPLKH